MENRIQSSLTGRDPGLRPEARLLAIQAAAPPPPTTSSFLDLAGALEGVNPSITRFLDNRRTRDDRKLKTLAEAEATKLSADGVLKATTEQALPLVEQGIIKKSQLPTFQNHLNYSLGTRNAEALNTKLTGLFGQTVSTDNRLPPAEVADQLISDGLKQFAPDDVHGMAGYLDTANQLKARFVQMSNTQYQENYTKLGEAVQADSLAKILARQGMGEDVSADMATWNESFRLTGGNKFDRRRFFQAGIRGAISDLQSKHRYKDVEPLIEWAMEHQLDKGVPFVTPEISAELSNALTKNLEMAHAYDLEAVGRAYEVDLARQKEGHLKAIETFTDHPDISKSEALAYGKDLVGSALIHFNDTIERQYSTKTDDEVMGDLQARLQRGDLIGVEESIEAAYAARDLTPMDRNRLVEQHNQIKQAIKSLEAHVDSSVRVSKNNPLTGLPEQPPFLQFTVDAPDGTKVTASTVYNGLPDEDRINLDADLKDWYQSRIAEEAAKVAAEVGSSGISDSGIAKGIIEKITKESPAATERFFNRISAERVRKNQVASVKAFDNFSIRNERMLRAFDEVTIPHTSFKVNVSDIPRQEAVSEYTTVEEKQNRNRLYVTDSFRYLFEPNLIVGLNPEEILAKRISSRIRNLPEGHPRRVDLIKELNKLRPPEGKTDWTPPKISWSKQAIADLQTDIILSVKQDGASHKEVLEGVTEDGIALDPKQLGVTFPTFTALELQENANNGEWTPLFLAVNEALNPGGDPLHLYMGQLANLRKELSKDA